MPHRVRRWSLLGALFVMAFVLVTVQRAAAETTREVRIRVVEAGSGKPLASAKVRYRGDAHEGTFTGHGGQTAILFDITATTNDQGVAILPATRFDPNRWGIFGLNTNLDGPSLIVTRAGYRSQVLNNHNPTQSTREYLAWAATHDLIELTPGADRDGVSPSQRLDEQDAFIRTMRDPDAIRKMLDKKNNMPPPVPKIVPGNLDPSRKAASPVVAP